MPALLPHDHARERDSKLLEFFEDTHVELYNLRDDLSEKHGFAKDLPDKANAWRDSVGAALPKPNPDFKGGKPKPQKSQVSP